MCFCVQTGKSAEYYLEPANQMAGPLTLSHRHILKQFGAEDEYADAMLSDQGISFSHTPAVSHRHK